MVPHLKLKDRQDGFLLKCPQQEKKKKEGILKGEALGFLSSFLASLLPSSLPAPIPGSLHLHHAPHEMIFQWDSECGGF